MNTAAALRVTTRSLRNLATRRPICVSFEVTHSCPADCRHCDKGGMKRDEARMSPEDYRVKARELAPAVVQLSGGEPLTRPDLEEIARAVKAEGPPPILICVTNGWLLDERRYLALVAAGVDLFSVSLDFPDARHDDFRVLPGLYARLEERIPRLARDHRLGNVALNTALTRANFAEIPALVATAERWGVRISFSAYSVLRTGDRAWCIDTPEELALLERHVEFLLRHASARTPW